MREQALGAQIVGREPELGALRDFVGADASARACVLTGGPGIGKTTLWEAGVAAARGSGTRVLVARPSDAEARLAFAALTDLFDTVDIEALTAVPEPQRGALQIALLRAEAGGSPPDARAIAAGVRSVLGALASDTPLLVAIDDVQWLDRPSSDALSFASRRLGDERVGFLLAKRPGSPSELERALERTALQRLDVGPLSLGATRRLLAERLGLSLPRHLLRRIVESTLGNPLFALEVGRVLAERESLEIGGELPVPDSVEDLLGTRIVDADGKINGCYRDGGDQQGELRLVSDPASCRSNEAAIWWNQVGPQGPVGPAVPAGPAGPAGPRVLFSRKWNGETWIVQVVAPTGYSPERTYSVTSFAHCVNA